MVSQGDLPLVQRLPWRWAGRSGDPQDGGDAAAAAGGSAQAEAPAAAARSPKPKPKSKPKPSLLVANMGAGEVAGVPDSPVAGAVGPALHGGAACSPPHMAEQPGTGAAGTPHRLFAPTSVAQRMLACMLGCHPCITPPLSFSCSAPRLCPMLRRALSALLKMHVREDKHLDSCSAGHCCSPASRRAGLPDWLLPGRGWDADADASDAGPPEPSGVSAGLPGAGPHVPDMRSAPEGRPGAPAVAGEASGRALGNLGFNGASKAIQGGAARPGGRRRLCLPPRVAAAPAGAAAAAAQGDRAGSAGGAAAALEAACAHAPPAGEDAALGAAAAALGLGDQQLQGVDQARDTDGATTAATSPLCSSQLQQPQAPAAAAYACPDPRCPGPCAAARPASPQAVQATLAVPESPCWDGADGHGGDVSASQLPLVMRVPAAAAVAGPQGGADPSSSARDDAGVEVSALQLPLAMRVPAAAAAVRAQGDADPSSSTMDDACVQVSALQLPLGMRIAPPAAGAQPPRAAAHSSAAEKASASELPLAMRVVSPAAGTQPPCAAAHSIAKGAVSASQLPLAMRVMSPAADIQPPWAAAHGSAAEEASASQLPLAMRVMSPAADIQPPRAAARIIAGKAVSALQLPLAMRIVSPAAGTQPRRAAAHGTPAEQVFGSQLLLAMLEQAAPPVAQAQGAGAPTGGQAAAVGGCSSASELPHNAQQQPLQGIWQPAPVRRASAGHAQEFVEPAVGGDGSETGADNLQLSQAPLAWRVPQPQLVQAAERDGPLADGPGAHAPDQADGGCLAAVQPMADIDLDKQPSQVPLARRLAAPQQEANAAEHSCAGGTGMQLPPSLFGRDVPRLAAERAAAAGASGAGFSGPSGEGTMQAAPAPLAWCGAPATHVAKLLPGAPGAAPNAGHGAAAVPEPDQACASFGAGHAGGAQGRPASGRAGAGRLGLGGARARRAAAPSFDLLAGILTGAGSQIRPAGGTAAAPSERQGCLARPIAGVPAAPAQHPVDGLAHGAARDVGGGTAHGGRQVAALQGLALRTGAASLMGPPAASPAGRTGGATQMPQARSLVPLLSPRDAARDGSGPSASLRTPMTAAGHQGAIGFGSSPSPACASTAAAAAPSRDPWSGAGWPSGDDDWGDEQWGAAASGSGLRDWQRAAPAAPAAAQRGHASTGTPLWQCGRKVRTLHYYRPYLCVSMPLWQCGHRA